MVPRTGCPCRALSLAGGSQHPGAGPWPAREGPAPCRAAPGSTVPGRLAALPQGTQGGRHFSPVKPVSRGHSQGSLPQPLGSLPALPSQPPCASGCTRGNAHTHTCTHRRGGRVPLLTPRGQHPNLSPPVLVSVILQDRVQTGLSWTHMCCHLTYSDWLVFVRFYCIFIVIKPRSSILPTPSVPSSAGLGFPPGRPGGVGVRSWLQPRFPRV